ncbi:MAG: hypothetical protein AAF581_15245 [Planctomycetota bacterium]
MNAATLTTWVFVAGVSQFAIITASLGVPSVLNWKAELAQLRPLNRQIFTTYAGYILGTNLAFALLSTFDPGLLVEQSPLAGWVSGFIALYWGVRLLLQFAYYRGDRPTGAQYVVAEFVFSALFLGLVVIYGLCCYHTVSGPKF